MLSFSCDKSVPEAQQVGIEMCLQTFGDMQDERAVSLQWCGAAWVLVEFGSSAASDKGVSDMYVANRKHGIAYFDKSHRAVLQW